MTYHVKVRRKVWQMRHVPGDTSESIYLISELRRRGVPMVGVIFIQGVAHGRFAIEHDPVTDEFIYQWDPDPRSAVPDDYDPELDGPIPDPNKEVAEL